MTFTPFEIITRLSLGLAVKWNILFYLCNSKHFFLNMSNKTLDLPPHGEFLINYLLEAQAFF